MFKFQLLEFAGDASCKRDEKVIEEIRKRTIYYWATFKNLTKYILDSSRYISIITFDPFINCGQFAE